MWRCDAHESWEKLLGTEVPGKETNQAHVRAGEQPTHARYPPSPVWASPMGPEMRSRVVAGTSAIVSTPAIPSDLGLGVPPVTGRGGAKALGHRGTPLPERVPEGCGQATPSLLAADRPRTGLASEQLQTPPLLPGGTIVRGVWLL